MVTDKDTNTDKDIRVGFTTKGNRHLYSDTFGRTKGLKKEDLKDLDKALANSTYVKPAKDSKGRKDGITDFYYFKDKNKNLYYNVAGMKRKDPKGVIQKSYFLYSVTERIK
jgi:hypothetical protein